MILLSGFHASFRRASSNDFLMPIVNVISGLPVDPMFGGDEFMLMLVQPSGKIWPLWMKYFKATGSPIASLAHQKYNLLEPLTSFFCSWCCRVQPWTTWMRNTSWLICWATLDWLWAFNIGIQKQWPSLGSKLPSQPWHMPISVGLTIVFAWTAQSSTSSARSLFKLP